MISNIKYQIDRIIRVIINIKKRVQLILFANKIHYLTKLNQLNIIQWAEKFSTIREVDSDETSLVGYGKKLQKSIISQYGGKYASCKTLRILIHTPSPSISPAGYSIFTNWVNALNFMGIQTQCLEWNQSIENSLNSFRPNIFLTSDDKGYIDRVNWSAVQKYRSENSLRIGLTASIEAYGNTPLTGRIVKAKEIGVNFYYSFRAKSYINKRKEYQQFFQEGYEIYNVEFSANPLLYFPVDGIIKDLSYIYLGSSNLDKFDRTRKWFSEIIQKDAGFINGPGWAGMNTQIPMDLNRYLYSRSAVGLNLHLQEQIEWASEINERTYVLAACGVPQLVDNPKLLLDRFSSDAVFEACNPKKYASLYKDIINNPEEAARRSRIALNEVYEKHTIFHRMEEFIKKLNIKG